MKENKKAEWISLKLLPCHSILNIYFSLISQFLKKIKSMWKSTKMKCFFCSSSVESTVRQQQFSKPSQAMQALNHCLKPVIQHPEQLSQIQNERKEQE